MPMQATSSVMVTFSNGDPPLSLQPRISIYGQRLAESTSQAQALPLPPQLVDTQVFVAGTTPGGSSTGLLNLPLYYVSQTR
jgi:uncharacterized protein (TIGR03437 family)